MNTSEDSGSIEIEAYPLDGERVVVGEDLFKEFCWAWIETKGPSLLKAVIRENELKERKPKLNRQNAGLVDLTNKL